MSLIRKRDIPRRDDIFFPIEQTFDRFFQEFFSDRPLDMVRASSGYPKMDIYEDEDSLNVLVAVSGMTAKDLDVTVDDGLVTISGKLESNEETTPTYNKGKYLLKELRRSSFSRQVRLPDTVEGDPQASLKDGLLKLTWVIRKDEPEKEEAKRIKIQEE